MWYLSLLLGLISLDEEPSNIHEAIDICHKNAIAENLNDLDNLNFNLEFDWTLESICPRVLGYMDCVDEAIQNYMGSSMAELQKFPRNPRTLKAAMIFNHFRDVFSDVCMSGSDLNNVYKSNEECFIGMELDLEICEENGFNFYTSIKNETESMPEGKARGNGKCFMMAYISACFAAKIHENCGADASDLYQTMVKISSIFSAGFCSEEGLDLLNTLVLDVMEQIEEHN